VSISGIQRLPGDAAPDSELAIDFFLLGQVEYERVFALQRRLAYEAGDDRHAPIAVLLCEHPEMITVGRRGSRAHVRLTNDELRSRDVAIKWVTRSGGCVAHGRGQLAVYPIVPLRLVGWSVSDYVRRLQSGMLAALQQFRIRAEVRPDVQGIWGKSGLLAAIGVLVKQGTTMHGAFLNVDPSMKLSRFVDSAEGNSERAGKRCMSSMLAERRTAVRMPSVRTAVIESLAASFGANRYHLFAGHPWLPRKTGSTRESITRN
jgi:lipoyl(octanoyl) transferase